MSEKILEERQTKIVCTIGKPCGASLTETVEQFHQAGMNVARLNMSHRSEDFSCEAEILETIANAQGPDSAMRVASLGDLQGPKIRLGQVAVERASLPAGEEVVLRACDTRDDEGLIPLAAPYGEKVIDAIAHALEQHGRPVKMTLGDGDATLRITEMKGQDGVATIETSGAIRSRMGVTIKDIALEVDSFTEKDREDLTFLMPHRPTFIGVSFVQSAEDLRRIRCFIRDTLKVDRRVPLIAKIETAAAVQNIKSIVMEADGIMVARGDLGLHIDIEKVPQVQKQIIRLGQSAAKPVIIATQMLESMTFNVEPTRAEVTDVFNAIMDGCDAVMLSGETSYGEHPVGAIQVMNRIAKRAELWRQRHSTRAMTEQIRLDIYDSYNADSNPQMKQIDDEIAHAVFNLAKGIDCHLIKVFNQLVGTDSLCL